MENRGVRTISPKESTSRDEFESGKSFTSLGLSALLEIRVESRQLSIWTIRRPRIEKVEPRRVARLKPGVIASPRKPFSGTVLKKFFSKYYS